MYMMPYDNYLDDFINPIDDLFKHFNKNSSMKAMNTDVVEDGDNYKLMIDVPGVKKEDIKIELEGGYLKVSVRTNSSSDEEKEENGKKCIRRERSWGSFSRSFYVGNSITQSDVKAELENGVLTLIFPKAKSESQKKFIEIN